MNLRLFPEIVEDLFASQPILVTDSRDQDTSRVARYLVPLEQFLTRQPISGCLFFHLDVFSHASAPGSCRELLRQPSPPVLPSNLFRGPSLPWSAGTLYPALPSRPRSPLRAVLSLPPIALMLLPVPRAPSSTPTFLMTSD